MLDLAVLDDFVGHTLDEVGRDGEADADGAGGVGGGGGGGDRGVDADHLAGRVEGRAAGVTGVDGRVDLDGVGDDLVVVVVGHGHRAVQGGDDAGGGGVVVAERVADGHHVLADGELVGIGEFHGLEVARRVVELDDRKIGGGVSADERGGIHVAVGKRHLNLLGTGDHVVVGDDVAFGVDDGAGALGGAVAQRGLDGDHGAGDIAGDSLPVGGFAALGGGGPGAGLIRADVGERVAGRQGDQAAGEGAVAEAQAEGRSQNGGDHGDEDVARRLGHALLGGAGLTGLTGLSRLGRTLTVRRTGTGNAETEQTALLGLLAILAILTGLAGKRVAVVLLRLRGRIERIAVTLRLRVIGVVGVAVALLALWGLLCRLAERELLRGLGIVAGLAALLALCLSRGRPISAVFRGRTIQRSCGRGLVCGRRCRRSRRGGDHRALALGGGVVRDGLGGGSVGSGLRRLLIGSEGGRGNRGLLLAGIAGVAGINRGAAYKWVLRLGVAGIGSTIGVFVIPRGLVDALRVKFVSHCCSFS